MVAYPACLLLRLAARQVNTDIDLRWEILAGTAIVTIVTALLAGIYAVRSVRRIEPMAFFRVTPGPLLTKWFGLPGPRDTYGRLGIIHCDEQPAIEVLEILAPVPPGHGPPNV